MENYPENRTYAIIPVEKVGTLIGNVLDIARKSIDKKFIVWDFPKDSLILNTLLSEPNIKLLTHKEAITLMSTNAWAKEEKNSQNTLKI